MHICIHRFTILLFFSVSFGAGILSAQANDSDLDAELEAVTKAAKAEQSLDRLTAAANTSAPELRLIDISVIVDFAFGGSDQDEAHLEALQAHNHDPKLPGAHITGVELSVGGAIDPYFYGEAHMLFSEGAVELEEAFLTSQALPWGFQVEMGYFLTEFGLHNPTHQHSWAWSDAPVIATRLFGSEGMRGSGIRISNLLPLPWYSEFHVGAQRAVGETMTGFLHTVGSGGHTHGGTEEQEEIGGRTTIDYETRSSSDLAYMARWENSFDIGKTITTKIGFSGMGGPNSTGSRAETFIYGGDILVKWRPIKNFRGFPHVIFQAEAMRRDFIVERQIDPGELDHINLVRNGDLFDPYDEREQFDEAELEEVRSVSLDTVDFGDYEDAADVLLGRKELQDLEDEDARKVALDTIIKLYHPFETLHDWGFYSYLLIGFARGWSAGVRYGYASGSGESYVDGGDWVNDQDPFGRDRDPKRDTRHRYSPMIQYKPSEFSRFRLQYNRESSDFLRRRRTYVTPLSNILPGTTDLPYEIEWHNRSKAAWSMWFTFEFLIGSHPAHKF